MIPSEPSLGRATPVDLTVRFAGLTLTNPVMPASGCFGPQLAPLVATTGLGAVVTKTVFPGRRTGNRAPRLAETAHGMLNSVGIPSPGIGAFIADTLPRYSRLGSQVIVSIGGLLVHEYHLIAAQLADQDFAAYEVNVSCPNLEEGGMAIGTSAQNVYDIVVGVRAQTTRPVIVKLAPAVSSIADIAQAAHEAGADALTVANSFPGLAVDLVTRRSPLGNGSGGYSGPGIKPLALKLVHDAAAAVPLPVIGCGGITTAADAAEFMLAGATAVQVGTANFTRPTAMADIVAELPSVCSALGATRVDELVGAMHEPAPGRTAA